MENSGAIAFLTGLLKTTQFPSSQCLGVFGQPGTKEELESAAIFGSATIIGNIEERDVEV